MKRLSLSVVLPCYNEEANVARTTQAALEVCRRLTDDFEIIIVDDGSRDATGRIADGLAAANAEVRVIHHVTNRGYGGALQSGFRAARKEWVFYTDGDGQFDFAEIRRLLPLLDRYDIVSGYRVNRQESIVRRFNGGCWSLLVGLILGVRLRDVDCAFKLYPRHLFERIEMRSRGALIDAEVLAKAHYLGYRIGQIGVRHYPRRAGTGTGASLKVIARAFYELVRLTPHILRARRRDRIPGECTPAQGTRF